MKRTVLFCALFVLLIVNMLFASVTGKIAGYVTDAQNQSSLPGANIVIEGTMMGAAANPDGYYVILNVPPGTYTLRSSMMGYSNYTVTEVRVNIDQTTIIDFKMNPEVISGVEIQVVAVRPVVEKDVAASKKNISNDQIQNLPVASVNEVMGLQAGITSSLQIRGGGSNETIFMVDGIILRDERNNEPITKIPLSAVQEISVQTGGFSAEYFNVRSGVVNVVTKEGDTKLYSGIATFKVRPPTPKHFGISPYDANSYWLRPYLDPAVCWTGTKSKNEQGEFNWDIYTQRQYPEFDGWNKISEITLQDTIQTNDLTPEAAQRLFKWEHRKQGDIKDADYYFDTGFGGPVPFISNYLGNLRFHTSYLKQLDMYVIELTTKALTNETWMLKLASDINPSMKLSILSVYGETHGTSSSFSGGTTLFETPEDVAEQMITGSFTVPWRFYTSIYWSGSSRIHNTFSAKFTHVLNPTTYYEVQLKRLSKRYHTGPLRYRDRTLKYEPIPGYFVDEGPIGFDTRPIFGITGLALGGPVSVCRDFSKTATYTGKFDLVSQINKRNQVKAGLELVYSDYQMSFGQVNEYLPDGNYWTEIGQQPYRLTLYAQDKIEFEGFISTLGLIMDYSNPNGEWYEVETYDRIFFSQKYKEFEKEYEIQYKSATAKGQLTVSPRLAIAHPITVNSKLYFNYGHYRQMPTSERIYQVQRDLLRRVDYLGDPTLPLAKTVSYELGYDHALFNDYLLHLATYYKDISDQEYWVRYISFDGQVNYRKLTNNSYQDIRGFEVDITKMMGRWFSGNINYEYRVGSSGYFGSNYYYENPAEQREHLRKNPKQEKPLPRPRVKSNIDIHTPPDFGPKFAGQLPLADWHCNILTWYTAGLWDTWNPNNIPGVEYNIQWMDYYNVDLKISKTFQIAKKIDLKFFVDIYNVFNIKYFSRLSFVNSFDKDYYMKSLHLPENIANKLGYGNIPGDDRPGDYRKTGVAYVPMEWIADVTKLVTPNPKAIYYDANTRKYMQFSDNQWAEVEKNRMNKILDDRAYIDMPNLTYFTFLNPRGVFFGLTLNINL